MDQGNGTGNKVVSAEYYHGQLMEIYAWPFAFMIIFCVLGVVGNSVVLYIYISKWQNTKTRGFIIAMACINLVNAVFNMPVEAYILYYPLNFDVHRLCKATRGLTFVINNVCGCLFVAIAIDRILLVYKPLQRNVLTMKYVRWSCLTSLLIGVVTSWPGFVFYGTATVAEDINGVIVPGKTCLLSDEFMYNPKWPKIFNVVLFVLMATTFIILIVLYSFVGKKIWQVTKRDGFGQRSKFSLKSFVQGISFHRFRSKRNMSSTNEDLSSDTYVNGVTVSIATQRSDSMAPKHCARLGRRISGFNTRASYSHTIAMLLIAVGFILSFLPYLVIVSLRYLDPSFYLNLSKSGRILYHVFLRTYFLNSVISPFIYCFVNKEFRTILKRPLCSR